MGLIEDNANVFRLSASSDSGTTIKPYAQFSNAKTAATKNGARGEIWPKRPPASGPKINPIPNDAPINPKLCARFSGAVTSAM